MSDLSRPVPVPDATSAPFWEGARHGALRLQQCGGCGKLNHPPAVACPRCGSTVADVCDVSGRATLHSWTILHDAPAPGFAPLLPLVLGVVALEAQSDVLISTNIVGAAPVDLRIDMPLAASFEPLDGETTLVMFRPVSA